MSQCKKSLFIHSFLPTVREHLRVKSDNDIFDPQFYQNNMVLEFLSLCASAKGSQKKPVFGVRQLESPLQRPKIFLIQRSLIPDEFVVFVLC